MRIGINAMPRQILINLCLTLFFLYLIFLVGIDQVFHRYVCIVVAFLLQYLTLASLMWMGVEAFNLYLIVVKVFDAAPERFVLKAAIIAWGECLLICTWLLYGYLMQHIITLWTDSHYCMIWVPLNLYLIVMRILDAATWRFVLTTKCIRYFWFPLMHNGVQLDPLWKLFPQRNLGTDPAPYLYTPKTTINQQNKFSEHIPCQNGGQYTNFHFAKIITWPKWNQNTSQKIFQ